MWRSDSEAQGRRREAVSEGSVEQRREPIDKNQIGGLRRWTSWLMAAKSTTIKGAGGKSGGLRAEGGRSYDGGSVAGPGIRTEGGAIHSDRAAEVSNGHCSRAAMKAQTERSGK
jgi:hypothetical protein